MSEYMIFTDSACDINPDILREWKVGFIELSFRFEGESKDYLNSQMNIKS